MRADNKGSGFMFLISVTFFQAQSLAFSVCDARVSAIRFAHLGVRLRVRQCSLNRCFLSEDSM